MTAADYSLTPEATARLTRRITWLSVATAGTLTALKAIVWLATGSVSILASLADSSLDLVAALGTFAAVRYAVVPPDAEHRFGHGKAEAFASLVQAGLVFASAALVGQDAVSHLLHPARISREGWAIAVMAVSTGLTFALITAQNRVLAKARSVAVSGDRAHYVADLASNIAALIALGLALLVGWNGFDAVGGLIVVAVLLWGAVSVFRQASNELMDHELPDDARARIVSIVRQDPRLIDVHQLRTRASGPIIHMQMHADLDPELTLVDAHQVIVAAEIRLLEAFPSADIIIHPDPMGRAEPHGGGAFPETHATPATDGHVRAAAFE